MYVGAVSKGCNLSCSDPDSGPCVSLETCRCVKEADEATCDIGQCVTHPVNWILLLGVYHQISVNSAFWNV